MIETNIQKIDEIEKFDSKYGMMLSRLWRTFADKIKISVL